MKYEEPKRVRKKCGICHLKGSDHTIDLDKTLAEITFPFTD